jgi:hypothetical protein
LSTQVPLHPTAPKCWAPPKYKSGTTRIAPAPIGSLLSLAVQIVQAAAIRGHSLGNTEIFLNERALSNRKQPHSPRTRTQYVCLVVLCGHFPVNTMAFSLQMCSCNCIFGQSRRNRSVFIRLTIDVGCSVEGEFVERYRKLRRQRRNQSRIGRKLLSNSIDIR